jgi:hypothetical protein
VREQQSRDAIHYACEVGGVWRRVSRGDILPQDSDLIPVYIRIPYPRRILNTLADSLFPIPEFIVDET